MFEYQYMSPLFLPLHSDVLILGSVDLDTEWVIQRSLQHLPHMIISNGTANAYLI